MRIKKRSLGHIYVMFGKKQEEINKMAAGDIGALAKLQNTETGDTLCDESTTVIFDEVSFPGGRVYPSRSRLSTRATKRKCLQGCIGLEEEDPTFRIEKQSETSDTLVSGLGELHLEVVCRKLHNKFGVEAQLSDPIVPYREDDQEESESAGEA